jgi:hypothetical protein
VQANQLDEWVVRDSHAKKKKKKKKKGWDKLDANNQISDPHLACIISGESMTWLVDAGDLTIRRR